MIRLNAKRRIRQIAIRFCRGLLRLCGRRYRLTDGMTIVFAPHQDDETIGCGGLIARKRHEGLPVHVVFITDGRSSHPGHPELTPAVLASLRHAEALAALALLGVESDAIHFLDESDGTLNRLGAPARAALVGKLAALLDDLRPGEIFLPCRRDGSDEHAAAFACVHEAVLRSPHRPVIWQYPIWAWWNPHLLVENLLIARETRRLPVEDFQSIKARAFACYRSQIEPTPPWRDGLLPAELQAAGRLPDEFFFQLKLSAGRDTATLTETDGPTI
jgi:LmbE family N-acetylglucosaminyl deacetylase